MKSDKIKVLHCLETISSGGVERRRLSICKLLPSDKFIHKIICTQTNKGFEKEFEKIGVEVVPVGLLNNHFNVSVHKKVLKEIELFNPDIIHGAVFEGVCMAAIDGWLKRVPIRIIEETSDPKNRTWRGDLLLKLYSLFAHKVVGVSPAACDYLRERANIPSKKVKLINNGVKKPPKIEQKKIRQLRSDYHIKPDDIVVGSVGRMLYDEHKQFSVLIKSFAQIVKENKKAKLLLVGDGKQRKSYEHLVKDLDITENVIFTGYQQNVHEFYAIMDIFTLVSAYEAFGLVVAEAMLNKLPSVVTNVGGIKTIIEHNQTGLFVEPKNESQITAAIKKLISDETLRKKLGNRAEQVALSKFTEEIYINNVKNMYLDLIQNKLS